MGFGRFNVPWYPKAYELLTLAWKIQCGVLGVLGDGLT